MYAIKKTVYGNKKNTSSKTKGLHLQIKPWLTLSLLGLIIMPASNHSKEPYYSRVHSTTT